MSSRAWIAAVALGLTLLASSGQAQEKGQGQEGQTAQQQSPSPRPPPPVRVEIVEDEAAADARDSREAEARQREIDDLLAQQGMNAATQAMNEATQRMANYSWWQTWLVAFGTALLFVTLYLTYQANRAAVQMIHANRAWVLFQKHESGFIINAHIDDLPVNKGLFISLRFQNFGDGPAFIKDIYSSQRVIGLADEVLPFQPQPAPNLPVMTLGKSNSINSNMFALNDAQLQAVVAGEARMIVYCRVRYHDVYSREIRVTEFCGDVSFNGAVDNGKDEPRPNISLSLVGHQNGAT